MYLCKFNIPTNLKQTMGDELVSANLSSAEEESSEEESSSETEDKSKVKT